MAIRINLSIRSFWLPFCLILLGFFTRLFPHPANFTPIGAIALLAGIYLPRKWSLMLPILAMFLSDMIIGFYNPIIMLSVYSCFALNVLIGWFVKKRKGIASVLGGAVSGSLIFFIVTNFIVWTSSNMYPHTLDGLLSCYMLAIPFFRNTLFGDIFFVSLLIGSVELISSMLSKNVALKKQKYD